MRFLNLKQIIIGWGIGWGISVILLAQFCLVSSICSAAVINESAPLVGAFKVNRMELANGLRLLVVEDHSSPTFAYQTWFRVGSRNEVKGYTGLAHLFEHMMFKGTKNQKDGEFDKLLERAGVEGENAFTSRDYTAYVQELPASELDLIAKLEADRMVNLVVDDKVFSTEREVVQNERRFRYENNPDGVMYQEVFGLAFAQHPYHWPVIGYQEDLERMSAQDAVQFYRANYSPDHATIVVIGDVQPAEVLKLVDKYYGSIPASSPSSTLTPPASPTTGPISSSISSSSLSPSPAVLSLSEPPQTSARHKSFNFQMQVEKLLIGYRIPEIMNDDMPAIEVFEAIVSGGKSSRFYRALVDTGISSSVDAYELDDKDPSLFIIQSNLQKGRKATQAETVILNEISRILKDGILEQELSRAKNRVKFNFYEGLTDNSRKASFLGKFESLAGTYQAGLLKQQKIGDVNAADIKRIAQKYFAPHNRVVISGLIKSQVKGETK